MMPLRLTFATALLAGAVIAGQAFAHHGWGSYDTSKAFTITAPVDELDWGNPHVHIVLKHEGESWEAILAPITRMTARGLSQEMLKPGTTVSVFGYPSTHEKNEMRAERITIAGKTFELR